MLIFPKSPVPPAQPWHPPKVKIKGDYKRRCLLKGNQRPRKACHAFACYVSRCPVWKPPAPSQTRGLESRKYEQIFQKKGEKPMLRCLECKEQKVRCFPSVSRSLYCWSSRSFHLSQEEGGPRVRRSLSHHLEGMLVNVDGWGSCQAEG